MPTWAISVLGEAGRKPPFSRNMPCQHLAEFLPVMNPSSSFCFIRPDDEAQLTGINFKAEIIQRLETIRS